MANKWGPAPTAVPNSLPIPRVSMARCLTLTKVSAGSVTVTAAGAGDTVALLMVGSVDLLNGATVTYATSAAYFAYLIAAKINQNTANHDYWATVVSDVVWIFPQDGRTVDTATITVDDTGFSATVANMNSAQTFVAAVKWDSGNLGQDAFADTGMYRVGFDFSVVQSLTTDWDATSGRAMEITYTVEDQTLDVYVGGPGRHRLTTTSPQNSQKFATMAVAADIVSMFLQSGGPQNPTYLVSAW